MLSLFIIFFSLSTNCLYTECIYYNALCLTVLAFDISLNENAISGSEYDLLGKNLLSRFILERRFGERCILSYYVFINEDVLLCDYVLVLIFATFSTIGKLKTNEVHICQL